MACIIQSCDFKYHFYVYRSNVYVQPKLIHWQLCLCLSNCLLDWYLHSNFYISNLTHPKLNLWFCLYSQLASSSVSNLSKWQCHPSTSLGWNLRTTFPFFSPFSYPCKEYANKSCSFYFHKNCNQCLSQFHHLPWLLSPNRSPYYFPLSLTS